MKLLQRKSPTKGVITIVISLLFLSAFLRITVSATEVVAQTNSDLPQVRDPLAINRTTIEPTEELLDALLKREQRILDMQKELAKREKIVSIARIEIERRITALKEAEDKLSSTLAQANTAAEEDVMQLIAVYENMKPKDTAALFETMEPAFAAGFLGRMRPEAAAGVLSGLNPKTAYTISVILAGRNANAPKN